MQRCMGFLFYRYNAKASGSQIFRKIFDFIVDKILIYNTIPLYYFWSLSMKKSILLLIILSILIIQCSEESSNENRQSQINSEFTEDNQIAEEEDSFSYETETNIVKIEEKNKTVAKENKATEVKTNELKNISESGETKTNEVEVKNENETVSENKINDIEKIVYISKTGKKYHLENCRTLRGEKEAIDVNEATKNGYEACKICNPDNV